MRRTWYALNEFETFDLTSRAYKTRHGGNLAAHKARQIASNFIQAREYFRSASAADRVVRPLLQYYGVAALSRGLILFLDVSAREPTLKPSHGLVVDEWQSILSGGLSEIGNLRVKLTEGIFRDLLVSTNNTFYFRQNSTAVNWRTGDTVPEFGSEFTFTDVASRNADVSEQYNTWTGLKEPSVVLSALQIDHEQKQYEFSVGYREDAEIEAIFPEHKCPNRVVTNKSATEAVVRYNQPYVPYLSQRLGGFAGIGAVVLYGPLASGLYLTPLATCFVSAYILGMLARYFPTVWISLGRSEKGDAVYPLVTRLMDWIEESFPLMVVDILRGPYDFEHSNPA